MTQWWHQGGHFPPVGGSSRHFPPTCLPPHQEKNYKNQPFLTNLWIFTPSEIHFALSMPLPHKIKKKKILVLPLPWPKTHSIELCLVIKQVCADCTKGHNFQLKKKDNFFSQNQLIRRKLPSLISCVSQLIFPLFSDTLSKNSALLWMLHCPPIS